MSLPGESKWLGLATQSHTGASSQGYEFGDGGSLVPSSYHSLDSPTTYDSHRAGGYHSGLNRIKYLHAHEIPTAFIQLPDAKTIMERIAWLGIIDDFDYFTYRTDDWSGYGNQCRITNPQMDKCMADFEHCASPISDSGNAFYLDVENSFSEIQSYLEGKYLWNQAMVAEDNYITIYSTKLVQQLGNMSYNTRQ